MSRVCDTTSRAFEMKVLFCRYIYIHTITCARNYVQRTGVVESFTPVWTEQLIIPFGFKSLPLLVAFTHFLCIQVSIVKAACFIEWKVLILSCFHNFLCFCCTVNLYAIIHIYFVLHFQLKQY